MRYWYLFQGFILFQTSSTLAYMYNIKQGLFSVKISTVPNFLKLRLNSRNFSEFFLIIFFPLYPYPFFPFPFPLLPPFFPFFPVDFPFSLLSHFSSPSSTLKLFPDARKSSPPPGPWGGGNTEQYTPLNYFWIYIIFCEGTIYSLRK